MKTVTVTVLGLKEVDAAFQELGRSISRQVALKGLRAGGEIIAKRARELAPKDEMHLSESIDVSTKLTQRQKAKHQKAAPVEMFVGANNPAAVPQEFGTFKEPPQPFMRPAFDGTKDEALKRISDTLMVEVDIAAKKAAAKAAKLGGK